MSEHKATPYEAELLRIQMFDDSRARDAAAWLKMRLWGVSESGPSGWLGDRVDDFEHFLLRRKAKRNLRRKAGN